MAQRLSRELNLRVVHPAAEEQRELLSLERFENIASWIHYGILGLVSLSDFDADPRFISQRLSVSSLEAAKAFDELKRFGFLTCVDQKWIQSTPPISVDLKGSSYKAKDFIRGLLAKATESLDSVHVDDRDMTSVTFSLDRKNVKEVRKRIKEFRRSLCLEFETKDKPQDVYTLSIQLFPLTRDLN